MVSVEEVAGPSCGEEEEHFPIGEEFEDFGGFDGDVGVFDGGGAGPIIADDLGWGEDGEGEEGAGEHETHEGDVGAIVDGGRGGSVVNGADGLDTILTIPVSACYL